MKFRKKPVVIEAVQFTGSNFDEVLDFVKVSDRSYGVSYASKEIDISTLEGVMTASAGDWVIKGVNGEFYPCKPGIFEKTYDFVED